MEQTDELYQNGHTKVYKEVNEDGTVTEYQEEQYVVEEVESGDARSGENVGSEVVVLQDDEDIKVYQQHEVLEDGREMITTTTVTLNEDGEAMEETVTEIVQSEEVEEVVYEEALQVGEEGELVREEDVVEEEILDTESVEEVKDTPIPINQNSSTESEEEAAEEEPSAEAEVETAEDTLPELQPETEDVCDEPVKTISRRISYEEFAEQYTEYKPPKRYEKKQTTAAADKAAPKIRIMNNDIVDDNEEGIDSQGLPNSDFYSGAAASGGNSMVSPRSSSHGDDICEEVNLSPQPTRTQGSVIGRMDQNTTVDPANVVRADDKPDMEAELPSRGTSQSLKSKFQAMDTGETKQVDFSQPVKRVKPKTEQNRNSAVSLEQDSSESTHRIPTFEGGEIENTPQVREDVVREGDKNDEEELPEIGQARNLLSKWSQIETETSTRKEYKPSGIGSKPTVTPMRPSSRVIEDVSTEGRVEPEVEGGEYENTPIERTDVVKASDTVDLEQELPTVGLAKSLMSQFKQKEAEAKKVTVYKPSGAGSRAPKVNVRVSRESSAEPHVEPQFEGGAVENTPVVRPDVVRESDHIDEQELPEAGYAKNLKARLRELQEQQRPADYVEHKPSGIGSKATPTPIRSSTTNTLSASINSLPSTADDVDSRVEPQLEGGEYENQPVKRTDVIREEDTLDEQELPEAGIAKNLMSRFKTLESEQSKNYKPSGVAAKATPSKLHIMAGKTSYSAKGIVPDTVADTNGTDVAPAVEAGEYENTPMVRDDVVRADSNQEYNDLPEEGVTKNIMSRFKNMEMENSSAVQHRPSKVASKPTPTPLRPSSTVADTNDTQSETSSTDNVLSDAGESENVPEVNHNVVRSSDSNEQDYIPTAGAAKNLMSN